MLSPIQTLILAVSATGLSFAGAAVAAVLGVSGRTQKAAAALAVAVTSLTAAAVAWLTASSPRPFSIQIGWIDSLDIGIGLLLDPLSFLFAILVSGISLLSLIYSIKYVPHEMQSGWKGSGEAAYYSYMLLFTGSMLGLVFASDMIQLFVFWELTGIASFLLIGLDWGSEPARRGALKALLITASGGIAMLLGFIILGFEAGAFSMREVFTMEDTLRTSPVFALALVLIVIGAITKSAQFPFHVWLPDAMVAPTPVSAFLHSAALVAAGVYLLARFYPLLSPHHLWGWVVIPVGAASIVTGAILALRANELKRLLAYSTISQYGFVFLLLGYGSAGAYTAALFNFFVHGLTKAGLFFAAGAVTYATGTNILGRMAGLWRRLPSVFYPAVILALSLGGVPLLAGFWMKEAFLASSLETGIWWYVLFGVVSSALTLVYMLRFLSGAFVGGEDTYHEATPVPPTVVIATAIPAALALALGLWPGVVSEVLVAPASSAVLVEPAYLDLSLHLDLKVLLSFLALGLGLAGYIYRPWRDFIMAPGLRLSQISLDDAYRSASQAAQRVGMNLLRTQNGVLRDYVNISLLGLLSLVLFVILCLPREILSGITATPLNVSHIPLSPSMVVLLILIMAGTVMTFIARQHSHMILALGAVGYLIAGVFALEYAPDVGLVQVHVETLVTVLFILALVLIPRPVRQRMVSGARERLKARAAISAAFVGLGSALLSWLAISHSAGDPIAAWFNDNSQDLAHASDVVAAILIDFRALDTLGEITVFATAAAGIYAIILLLLEDER